MIKLYKHHLKCILVLLLAIGAIPSYAVQLSGTYTINPSLPASASNFQNFASAITYLTVATARADGGPANASPFGVSGAVRFDVAAATYTVTAAIIVPAITGSSATNTITFDGGAGNAATRIITGSLATQAIIRMNLCSYVSFRNLTIANTNNGARSGIAIVGNSTTTTAGSGCAVKNCIINLPNSPTSAGWAINVTGTTNGHGGTTASRVQDVEIDSNTVNGGNYGIAMYGAGSTIYNGNIKVRYNTINTINTYGIDLQYIYRGVEVLNNKINMYALSTATQTGVYIGRCENTLTTAGASHIIAGNAVKNAANYGFHILSSTSTTTYPTRVYNNMVSGGFRNSSTTYGFFITSSATYVYHLQFYHNSVLMDFPSSTVRGLNYVNGSAGTAIVKNNVFTCIGAGGVAVPAYLTNNYAGLTVNNNNYYNSDGTTLLYRAGLFTAGTYKTNTTGGDSSINVKPLFKPTDLHLGSGCAFKGTNLLALVPLDIDGHARSATPDMGCDEFMRQTNDLMVEKIVNPVAPITLGPNNVSVLVRNTGASVVNNYYISYTHNGAFPVSQFVTNTLALCDTVTVTFAAQANLVASNTFNIYTSDPNYVSDDDRSNDTIKATLTQPLNGNYTIGGTTPDFANFAAATSALKGGVTGPVTFTVAAGTYSGQVIVEGPIPGASSSNTITFEGVDYTTRTITANVASGATVLVRNVGYVTFNNFTINNTNTGNSAGVALAGTTRSCRIKNNVIKLSATTSTSYGVVVTGNLTGFGISSNVSDSVVIDSNRITNGYCGIYVMGNSSSPSSVSNSGLKIRNNYLNQAYAEGIHVEYVYNAIDLLYNKVIMDSVSSSGSTGIYIFYCQNTGGVASHQVIGNYVKYGRFSAFYLYYLNGTNAYPDKIYNNVAAGGFGYDYEINGFLLANSSSGVSEVYHNTINIDSTDGQYVSREQFGLYWEGSASSKIKNNIITHSKNTTAPGGTFYPYYSPYGATANGNLNHNLYYNGSGQDLMFINGTAYSPFNFKTNSAGGDSSVNFVPPFVNLNAKDLRITSGCLTGTNLLANVPLDINGNVRSLSVLGAYSPSVLANNLAIQQLIQPVAPVTLGAQDLIVRIQNTGSNAVSSFNTSYTLNNGTPVTQSFSGVLNACDTTLVTFTGGNQVTLGASNNIKVYVSDPNFTTDADRTNDTIAVNFVQPMNGNYTIGASGANFTSFTSAINAMYAAGVSGPVTFTVNAGTYTEQIAIVQPITGLSATNTVTFDGVNPATRILTYSNTSLNLKHTVKIGQSHIRFRNLGLQSGTSGYGWIVHIGASGLSNIHIKNCRFSFTDSYIQQYPGDYYNSAVIASTNNDIYMPTYTNTMKLDSVEIDSNVFDYGYYGVVIDNYYGVTTPAPCNAISVSNNAFNQIYSYGIYMMHTKNFKVSNNVVNMDKSGSGYAIFIENDYGMSGSLEGGVINNNRIRNAYIGIYFYGSFNTLAKPTIIANNIIGKFVNGAYNGIYVSDCENTRIYHNSVNYDVTAIYNFNGPFQAYSSGLDIRNNHFTMTSYSLACPANIYVVPGLTSTINNNNYYKPGGTQLVLNGANYDKTSFVGVLGYNANSISTNPKFTNDSLLMPANSCLNGDSVIGFDYSANTRPLRPDLGAHEMPAIPNDAGVTALLQPVQPVLAGFQDLRVKITNFGSLPLTSADVAYRYNATTPVVKQWFGNLATCDTASVLFSGSEQVNITSGTTVAIKAYTANPNFVTDALNANDTVDVLLGTPLNGIYTIGGSSPDFATFTAATDALKYRGINGAVLFNVRNGTYNEAITIEEITGSSATNTVTFKAESNVRTNVTLSYTGNSSRASTVTLFASYVNFRTMSISALDATYGQCISFISSASYDTIENCVLTTAAVSSTSTDKAIIYANAVTGGNYVIKDNVFNNGAYSIYLYGISATALSNRNVIENNVMNSAYYRTIYTYYTSNLKVRRNVITASYTSHYGITTFYSDSALEIVSNKLTIGGGYAIYHYYCDGLPGFRGLISNNVVAVGGTSTTRGLHSQYCSNTDIYNNTINVTNTSATLAYAAYFYYNSSLYTNNVVRNNVFSNVGGGPALYNYAPNTIGNTWNDNLYYATGSNLVQVGTPASTFATLPLYTATYTALDINSITYAPPFTSSTNLAPNLADAAAWVINGRGVHNALVPTDVNGVARPMTLPQGAPDWGAFEFTPTSIPPSAVASPASAVAGTTQTFTLLGDTIAQIEWGASAAVPASIVVKQYSGARPQNITTSEGHTFFYTDISASAGTYDYALHLYYKDHWLGNVSTEADLRMAKKSGTNPWSPFTGTQSDVDVARNRLNAYYQSSFSLFSGTDNINPLPVVLTGFNAQLAGSHVNVTWNTASETNVRSFIVEASVDGKTFRKAGELKAKGSSATGSKYLFVHEHAQAEMNNANVVYYRLVSVDRDGSSKESKVVSVVFDRKAKALDNTVVYPNPFTRDVTVSIPLPVDGKAEITITDLQGRTISMNTYEVFAGVNNLVLNNMQHVETGVYFVKVMLSGELKVIKVVKQ